MSLAKPSVRFRAIADISAKLQDARMWSVAIAAAALAASSPKTPLIEAVEVREFDPYTGQWFASTRFNDGFFNGWNWRLQERDGSDDDLEIVFKIRAPPNSVLAVPFTVSVTAQDKVVEQRDHIKLAIPKSGHAYQLLHLRDLACAGPVYVTASLGAEKISLKLGTECGE